MSDYIITGAAMERWDIPAVVTAGEVVRCRDCKRWESGDCDWNPYYDDPVDDQPDGFCSWAVRRDA